MRLPILISPRSMGANSGDSARGRISESQGICNCRARKCWAKVETLLTLPSRKMRGALTRFHLAGALKLSRCFSRIHSVSSVAFVWAFRLDKHSDAKRFFVPLSRYLWTSAHLEAMLGCLGEARER